MESVAKGILAAKLYETKRRANSPSFGNFKNKW